MVTRKEEKIFAAALIPYRIVDGEIEVFLQKKDDTHPTIPNYFSFWGGMVEEGETPEEAVVRETKEELDYELKDYRLFGAFENDEIGGVVDHVYTVLVPENFDESVTVLEGEYGKFFTHKEIIAEIEKGSPFWEHQKQALKDFFLKSIL